MRAPAAAGVFVCAALAAGCATPPQTAALRAAPPASLAATRVLASVPFYAQDEYQCGPAALAMALAASGAAVTPQALQPLVYVPARQGSLQPEMLAAARRHGRLAVVLPPRLTAVLAEVAGGTPVIVLQNLSLPIAPVWHYAVVIGYDLAREEIVLHSGRTAEQRLPLAVFERTWARSGYWAMVATAPERLPMTPPDEALVAAAAALEAVDVAAARRAYAAILARAPALYAAWMGLGNSAYALGDPAAAAQAFARATQLQPQAADALNNLALALLASGRLDEARAAAQRAVEIGGPRLERYRQTLAAIERATR
jgi:tetratricopeptide (TPR) repeat protein